MAGTVLHVAEDANGGDGSNERPVGAIQDALAIAKDGRYCSVSIRVQPGAYNGTLEITRDTKLIGAPTHPQLHGAVRSEGPWELTIRDLDFQDSPPPAAIMVEDPRATTRIERVSIVGASGSAIRQIGGEILVRRLTVTRTVDNGTVPARALSFESGASAVLKRVVLSENASQSLVAEGAGTMIRAHTLEVLDTTLANNAYSGQYGGALQVTDGAVLYAERLGLMRNALLGLHVDDGGQGKVKSSIVRSTRSLKGHPSINIAVTGEGVLELEGFASADADIGILSENGFLTARKGHIHHNSVGVRLQRPPRRAGYHAATCVVDDIEYTDNGENFDAERTAAPEDDWCPSVPSPESETPEGNSPG